MIASHHTVTTTSTHILAQMIQVQIHIITITLSVLHQTHTMIATAVVILHGILSWKSLFIEDKFLQMAVIVIVIQMIASLMTFIRTISIEESTTIGLMVTDTSRFTVTYTLKTIMMITIIQTIITILTIITTQTTTTQMTIITQMIITQVMDITQATIMMIMIITTTHTIMSQRNPIMIILIPILMCRLSKHQRNIMNINLGTKNLTFTFRKKAATMRLTF